MEAILNSSFDWNGIRAPYIVATENDSLNGASHVVRLSAHEHRADFRRRAHVLESRRGQARHRPRSSTGAAAGGILHLINSGAATLDGTGQQARDGKPAMKPFWEITEGRGAEMPRRDDVASVHHRIFPRRRLVLALPHARRHAGDDVPVESGQRPRPGAANRRRLDGGPAGESPRHAGPAHQSDLADDVVRAER